MNKFFNKISFSKKTIPWFLLGLSVISFGLLTPWLGFYQDDWHHIFYFSQGGAQGLKDFLFTDSRPFAYLIYAPLFKLLGTSPFAWQISALFFRFFIGLTFWAILNQIWKKSHARNAIVASLFLVYPVFLIQPMSVMFALHWAMYLVYMLSVLAMLKAVQSSRYFYPLLILSLALEASHLIIMEYFVGIEFLRPLFLFMLLREKPIKERLQQTLKLSVPFLIVTIIYIIFRSSYGVIFEYDRNTPVVLFQLFSEPLPTIGYLIQIFFQDFAEILITSWYEAIQPSLFSFSRPKNLLIWVGVASFTVFFWAYFSKLEKGDKDAERESWAKEIMLLGVFGILFGVAPGWAVGKTVHGSNPLWNDRFAMAAMFGAAMFWVGLLFATLKKKSYVLFALGFMVSLAIGANLRAELSYKQAWEKQQKFYWQLYWRAPSIEEGTALITESEFLSYMGIYPTSFAINTLYQNAEDMHELPYWLYVVGEHLPPKWEWYRDGAELSFTKYASDFQGYSTDTLPILFEPEKLQCLWLLRPEDQFNRSLPEIAYQYIPVANPGRTLAESTTLPPEDIFGKEPEHDRCYFYEKAALAHQSENWEKVATIWDEAEKLDKLPYSGVEYIPFIEAFAHLDDWGKAEKLTLHANRITERMNYFLCDVWLNLDYENAPDDILEKVSKRLSCEALLQ